MGDARFQPPYDKLKEAVRPAEILRAMSSEDVIAALAAASREQDPYLANVLATEAQNRVGREGAAIESMSAGVYIVDAEARVVYINGAAARLIQRPEDELLGRPSREVVDLKDSTLTDANGSWPVEAALATGRVIETEHGVLHPHGQGEPLLVSYSAVPILRGSDVTGVVIAMRDITARKRAQTALAMREAQLRTLLDAIPDAILVLRPDGRVRYANPAAQDLFGRGAKELLGIPLGVQAANPEGIEVDVSSAGGSWKLARQRTIPFDWEYVPSFLAIYSEITEDTPNQA